MLSPIVEFLSPSAEEVGMLDFGCVLATRSFSKSCATRPLDNDVADIFTSLSPSEGVLRYQKHVKKKLTKTSTTNK